LKSNILFILVDSLRADKLEKYSNNNESCISNLIKNGTYFSNAFSSSDYTVTGYGSIFTSKYPVNAGLTGMNYHKIFSKNKNFISLLQENGYHTYTTMDNSFQNLGFSSFFENEDQGYDRTKTNLFDGLDKKIIEKVTSNNFQEPWFYFVHLDDLHIPVRVPEEFKSHTYEERYDLVISKIDTWLDDILQKIDLDSTIVILTSDHGDYIPQDTPKQKSTFNLKLKAKLKAKIPTKSYDVLSSIKKDVKKQVNDSLLASDTKTTINSRTSEKRYLFDDVIHIPLLFYGNKIPKNGKINDLVRSVDIFPTIWEFLSLPKPEIEIDGRSLLPLFNNQTLEKIPIYLENTVFATGQKVSNSSIGLRTENYKYFRFIEQDNPSESVKSWWKNLSEDEFNSIKSDEKFVNIHEKFSWNELTLEQHESIRSYYNLNVPSETKNIVENKNFPTFLYDVINDPNEVNNLASSNLELVANFEENLMEIRSKLLENFSAPDLDDEETKNIENELRKLGYV